MDVPVGGELDVVVVIGGHVCLVADVLPDPAGAVVRGDLLALLGVDEDHRPGVDHLDLLPDEPVRDGVVALLATQIDEAVGVDLQLAAVLDLEALCPQGLQGGLVDGDEAFLAGEGQALHAPLVVEPHLRGYGLVELVKREELSVAQRGVHIVIGELDVVLDQCLVLRLARPGGYGHAAEVLGEVLERPVDLRRVAVGLHDRRLEIVRHDDLRDAADVPEAAFQGVEEVVDFLGMDRHCEAVVRRGQRGHEDLAPHLLPRVEVDVGERVSGEVHEQVLSALAVVGKNEGGLLRLRELVDMEAELRVAVAVGVLPTVFPPQQVHRHMLPLQLRYDVWQPLLESLEAVVAVGRVTVCQHALYLGLLHRQQRRDGDAAGLGHFDIFVDRALVDAQFPAYLPVRFSVYMKT